MAPHPAHHPFWPKNRTCQAFATKPGAPCDEANPTTSDSIPLTSTGGGTGRDSPPASPSPTRPEPCDEADPTAGDSSLPDLRTTLSYSTSEGGVDSADPMKFDDEPQVAAHFPDLSGLRHQARSAVRRGRPHHKRLEPADLYGQWNRPRLAAGIAFANTPGAVRRGRPHHKRLEPADLRGRR
ncbi:hypothetical protein CYMTET_20932 [Cymbomonas tetramitiformis]|uniref:Uncharacterized protein n=1 Tax=Cymbomonas tetramitiformis TaxID=36881 RepID=A0AAE0L3R7_9CHLO|nr:hypothetical protein CYMTET_20932 [Cymbomonas tetramitiformis]